MEKPQRYGPRPYSGCARCPACDREFKKGDYTAFVVIGPGDDSESRQLAREGRPYCAVAVECCWACVTGEEAEPAGVAGEDG